MKIRYNDNYYNIDTPVFTIGSDKNCSIVVDSIKESVILLDVNGKLIIKNISSNKIVVNNKKLIKDEELEDGSKFEINGIEFFVEDDNKLYLYSVANLPLNNFIERVNQIINCRSQEEAAQNSLELLCNVIGASAGRVVVEESGKFKNLFAFPVHFKEKDFSQFVIDETKRLNSTILIKNTTDGNSSDSININYIRSVLCSPIKLRKETIDSSFIYLDKREDGKEFLEEDRKLLESFTSLIESLINNAITVETQAQLISQLSDKKIDFLFADKNMEQIISTSQKIARINIPVLLYGETGVGKEQLAKFIHNQSNRKDKPFVVINSSAISENLIESELFGYKKGAFTGATKDKIGLIKQADGGTLFLDEIGDIPLLTQVKLLRVLQEGKILPVGAVQEESVDVRLITATNKNLKKLIENESFREDLYYRINGIEINIPPLRERPNDIILFANYFIKKYSNEFNMKIKELSKRAESKLLMYSWPGNVRELEMSIKKAIVISSGNKIEDIDFDFNTEESNKYDLSLSQIRDNAAKEVIIKFLKFYRGNISRVSEKLKVERKSLTRIMDRLNIDVSKYRDK